LWNKSYPHCHAGTTHVDPRADRYPATTYINTHTYADPRAHSHSGAAYANTCTHADPRAALTSESRLWLRRDDT
jgi:hypothetical protein